MKTRILLAIGVVLGIGGASFGQQTGASPPQLSFSDYNIIAQRNIFSRSRGVRERPARFERGPSLPRPEQGQVLTGIVELDNQYIAYLESARTGATVPMHVGDTVGTGKIVKIDIDALEFEAGGKSTRVEIGRTLAGEPASEATAAVIAAAAAATTQPADGSTPATAPGNDILEKLRLKRQQELGRIGQ